MKIKTINIHEAKTHLSRLVDEALDGHPFIIAKAGRPMVRVSAIRAVKPKRIGFLKGEIRMPRDFDRMGKSQIEALFGIPK